MVVLDGKACSAAIEAELKTEIASFIDVVPKLVLILVTSNPDSKTYIRLKKKACERVGILVEVVELPESTRLEELVALIQTKNENQLVHGILVQLPLPEHLNEHEHTVLHSIDPAKDVDGLHPVHFYQLANRHASKAERNKMIQPCTPAGCLELLERNDISVDGKDVVMVGRGALVGLPLTLMLLARNATVTTCHTSTVNLQEKVERADIVIVGVGVPHLIKGEWIKPGAVVVDVGINYVDDANSPKGYVIQGDVEYDVAKTRASAITPVPGGIGPMTIAMLLHNTVRAYKQQVL